MLAVELVERGARNFADEIAILEGGRKWTFREANEMANRFANALLDLGGRTGDRYAILTNNSALGMCLDLAGIKGGFARASLNSRLSVSEQFSMIKMVSARFVIYTTELIERAGELKKLLPGTVFLGLGDDSLGHDLIELARSAPDIKPEYDAEPDDLLFTNFTSGTSGKFKAVMLTQQSYAAGMLNIVANMIKPQRGAIMLHAASMGHASGAFVLPYWALGGCAAILDGFHPQQYLDAVERWQPTAINLVPTMISMLVEQPDIAERDFSSIQTIIYGASPMPQSVLARGLKLWGPKFVQYYGQTETQLCISCLHKQDHIGPSADHRRLSAGRPAVDCEVRIVDDLGKDIPWGEPGEIIVRTSCVMKGYFENEEITRQSLSQDGWLKTRDIGRFDEDGFLYLVDRVSEMIISGGFNIYPREVEDALYLHHAVEECAVVGLPDNKWGEVVTAFVVPRKEHSVSEHELIELARQQIASYKVPKSVRFIDEVPKSPIGKPLRRKLREPYWEERKTRI